jgi:hypothetical protein
MKKKIYHLNGVSYFVLESVTALIPMDGSGEVLLFRDLPHVILHEVMLVTTGEINQYVAHYLVHFGSYTDRDVLIRWYDNCNNLHLRAYISILLGINDGSGVATDLKIIRAIVSENYSINLNGE